MRAIGLVPDDLTTPQKRALWMYRHKARPIRHIHLGTVRALRRMRLIDAKWENLTAKGIALLKRYSLPRRLRVIFED